MGLVSAYIYTVMLRYGRARRFAKRRIPGHLSHGPDAAFLIAIHIHTLSTDPFDSVSANQVLGGATFMSSHFV